MVIGLYAGIDFSSTDYCSEVYGLDEGCIEAGRNLTAGVRLGAPVGNALVYAKGGYSNGQLKIRYEDFEDILEDFSLREDRGGWHAGAGVEVGLAANFYGKVEYVYTNYNGADFDSADFGAEIDGSRQQLLFGLGYRF
jgi:outer membrane immunogenic protein